MRDPDTCNTAALMTCICATAGPSRSLRRVRRWLGQVDVHLPRGDAYCRRGSITAAILRACTTLLMQFCCQKVLLRWGAQLSYELKRRSEDRITSCLLSPHQQNCVVRPRLNLELDRLLNMGACATMSRLRRRIPHISSAATLFLVFECRLELLGQPSSASLVALLPLPQPHVLYLSCPSVFVFYYVCMCRYGGPA